LGGEIIKENTDEEESFIADELERAAARESEPYKPKEARLVVDIPTEYMEILDFIRETIHIPKKGIISRALRDYFYKHKDMLKQRDAEAFLIEYLEGR